MYLIHLNDRTELVKIPKSLSYFSGFNTYENVSRTFFGLRVYNQVLKYTLIKQQAKIELFGLISNVSGTLGLFIGFSFIRNI